MTDASLYAPLTGGATQEVPLTSEYRSVLEHVVKAGKWEAAEHGVAFAAIAARGLGSGLNWEADQVRRGWTSMEAAKQDLDDGNFLRYSGPVRLVFQTVDYKKPFSFRHISLETVLVLITGRSLGLPSADVDALASTTGERRSSPDGQIRTITTTGEVEFTRHSKAVFIMRGPDGTTIYVSEDVRGVPS